MVRVKDVELLRCELEECDKYTLSKREIETVLVIIKENQRLQSLEYLHKYNQYKK